MLNVKLAFRNLFRNTRRTLLTMSAMSAATFLLMITLSINDGFLWSMILSSTDYFHAHIKITSQKYEDKKDLHHTVSDTIDNSFINYSKIKGISPRITSNLLFSHQKEDKSWSVPAELLGISPKSEATVTKLHQSVIKGSYISSLPQQKLVIGRLLAKSLRAKVGDEIIVMGQGAYGAVASGLFIVSGIISTSDNLRDSRLALAHIKDVQEILGLYDQAHYYTASIHRVLEAKEIAKELQHLSTNYHVDSWRDILEQVSQALDFWIISQIIILCIFYFAVILICANTMSMSIMERKYEFATLRAIGLTRFSILKILTLEGVFLSCSAAIIGGVIGLSLSFLLYYYPIDLSSYFGPLAWGGSSFQPLIRAYPSYFNMFLPVCVMMVLGVITTIYPTIKLLATPLNQVMGDR
ncbi:MAG: ABC transporter permease [Candidatus Cloacimonetes bacterium]|nr:ABC transporter permease [Candidatus Cloacimonadota bacterium]